MKKVTVTNVKMVGLRSVLKVLAESTLPIKFTLARNLKALEGSYEEYTEEKNALHKKHVLLNENGEGVIKDEFTELLSQVQSVPYQWFEYSSEKDSDLFFKALEELNTTEVEIGLHSEQLDRKVKVKLGGEASETIETLTLQEILEDPSSKVNANALAVLLEYEILK